MKKFEFPLDRVLDLRRQQLEVERARLQTLRADLQRLESEKTEAQKRVEAARDHVRRGPSTTGQDLMAMSNFQKYIGRLGAEIDKKREKLSVRIAQQQAQTREAEKNVKLLEKLEARKRAEWTIGRDKELEELAADSYMARLLAGRRSNEPPDDG